jgi:hypothetical protein
MFPGGQPASEENKPVEQLTLIGLNRSGTSSAWHQQLSSSELSYFFSQINNNLVNGFLPANFESALILAALQAQVEWGEYDPAEEEDTDRHKLS